MQPFPGSVQRPQHRRCLMTCSSSIPSKRAMTLPGLHRYQLSLYGISWQLHLLSCRAARCALPLATECARFVRTERLALQSRPIRKLLLLLLKASSMKIHARVSVCIIIALHTAECSVLRPVHVTGGAVHAGLTVYHAQDFKRLGCCKYVDRLTTAFPSADAA